MSILPQNVGLDTEIQYVDRPTNTFIIDWTSRQIRGMDAGLAAMRQAVEQADGNGPHTPDIFMAGDLAGAVKEARAAAQPGDIVVLSPACAAFDRFKNFMERGQVFKQLVQEL